MTTSTLPADPPQVAPSADGGEPLRVIVADDHPLFRRGVARAIDRHPNLLLLAEAGDGEEAIELIDALQPDVALLDHRMPGLTGVEVCAVLGRRPQPPPTALLLLSAFEDADIVWEAVSAGASGYVGKTASQSEICEAVERVGRGGIAFTPSTARGVEEGFRRRLGAEA